MASTGGRDHRAYRRARQQVLEGRPPCSLCGKPINYDAPARTRWSPSVDHHQPLSLEGDLTDLTNLRAAHYGCNSARGNRTTVVRRGSRDW